MKRFTRALVLFVPFAVVITCAFGLVELEVQQSYRQGANDPQIQIAEDAANAIQGGRDARGLVPTGTVDLRASLAPFVVVYDARKQPVAGSGYLDGRLPTPPLGTFDGAVREQARPGSAPSWTGENRFSWQPRSDVRIAAVLVPVDGGRSGYVLAGRSLKEVEVREANLNATVMIAWLITMLATAAAVWLTHPAEVSPKG